jgi:ABC-type sugar transport system ATPase subunit
MSSLSLQGLTKYFGRDLVIEDVNLDVADGEFVVMLGPSGCGKTTILRMIAGFEKVTSGKILVDGTPCDRLLPQERDMAMVFQNYALYAHLSVRDNLAFGLRMRHTPKRDIADRIEDVARMLQIERLLDRKPSQLSGGERQRVALGRAIVRKPRVFLMDEPLSNLDALLRVQTRAEMQKLLRSIDATVLYVTHDQTEAMSMADKIVLLNEGRIQQIGMPNELYERPANRFAAKFVGSLPMNLLDGGWIEEKGERTVIRLPQGMLATFEAADVSALPRGDSQEGFTIGVRPEHLRLETPKAGGGDESEGIAGTVDVIESLGRENILFLNMGDGEPIRAIVNPSHTPQRGAAVRVSAPGDKVHIFRKVDGTRVGID